MDNEKVTSIPLASYNLILAVFILVLILIRYCFSEFLLFFVVFFPIIPFILLFVFIGTIVFCIKNIQRIKNLAITPFLIVLIGILILVFVPFTNIKLEINFKQNYNKRLEVVELIEKTKSEANDNGFIILPDQYKNISKDGKVQIENEDGVLRVLFFTFIGVTDNYSGYVYISDDIELSGDYFNSRIIQCIKKTENWYFCAFS